MPAIDAPPEPHALTTPGLDAGVEIIVDRWGIPHIYATTIHDAFFAQCRRGRKKRATLPKGQPCIRPKRPKSAAMANMSMKFVANAPSAVSRTTPG